MKIVFLLVVGVVAILAEESPVLKDFVAGNVEYIGNVYRELAKSNPANFLVCPLSLQTVFALINGGAKGNTLSQISRALHLPESEENTRLVFQNLAENFQGTDKYTLSSANKIYLADHFKISEKYKTSAVNVFKSEIQNIDFGNAAQASQEINKWVEEKTQDKIKDFISQDLLGPNTVAFLINALYFQGKWVKEFSNVVPMLFYGKDHDGVLTDMMTTGDYFKYYESKKLNAKFLEMPYKGEDISMVFVLPNRKEGLFDLEEHIADVLVAPQFRSERVNIVVPKFKIETTTDFIPILKNLGIVDAFSGLADFSELGGNSDSLTITTVLQKTFIEVDEKGTTAAAASGIGGERSARVHDELTFIADHPFLFYLKHKSFGVFFIGRFSEATNSTLM